jgi:transposase
VTEISEYLTTKTCSNCGNLNELGKKKIHECKCKMYADRHENSAKNHLKLGLTMKGIVVNDQNNVIEI